MTKCKREWLESHRGGRECKQGQGRKDRERPVIGRAKEKTETLQSLGNRIHFSLNFRWCPFGVSQIKTQPSHGLPSTSGSSGPQ